MCIADLLLQSRRRRRICKSDRERGNADSERFGNRKRRRHWIGKADTARRVWTSKTTTATEVKWLSECVYTSQPVAPPLVQPVVTYKHRVIWTLWSHHTYPQTYQYQYHLEDLLKSAEQEDAHVINTRTRKAQKTGAYILPIKKTNTLDIKTTTTMHTVKTQINLHD